MAHHSSNQLGSNNHIRIGLVARICRSQSSKDDQFRQGRGSIPRFGIILLHFLDAVTRRYEAVLLEIARHIYWRVCRRKFTLEVNIHLNEVISTGNIISYDTVEQFLYLSSWKERLHTNCLFQYLGKVLGSIYMRWQPKCECIIARIYPKSLRNRRCFKRQCDSKPSSMNFSYLRYGKASCLFEFFLKPMYARCDAAVSSTAILSESNMRYKERYP